VPEEVPGAGVGHHREHVLDLAVDAVPRTLRPAGAPAPPVQDVDAPAAARASAGRS
jgi:hypothetical protein